MFSKRKRKCDNEKLVLAVFYDLLDTVCNEREPNYSVYPHYIAVINYHVSRHCVERGECKYCKLVLAFGMLVEIEPHGKSAKGGFDAEKEQNEFLNSILGEKANEIGKRTCKIICVKTHKFAAKRARPGV